MIQTFVHDYTKPAQVEDLLYRAQRLLANDCMEAAKERICEARELLQAYLASDNMIADDDCAYGWIKVHK